MTSVFGRHGREFARAIRRQEWERTPEGVRFPRQGALLCGEFIAETNAGVFTQPNVVCDGGLSILGSLGAGLTGFAPLWVAPFGFDVTPHGAWTGYDLYFAGELGDGPNGYDEATRQEWVYIDEGSRILGNTASPAAFTMRTASTIVVYGFALIADADTKQTFRPTAPYNMAGLGLGGGQSEETPPPIAARSTPFGTIRTAVDASFGTNRAWLDPSNDDFYDSNGFNTVGGLIEYYDPTGDALAMDYDVYQEAALTGGYAFSSPVFSAARFFSAPLSFSDMDPLNVTYRVRLL